MKIPTKEEIDSIFAEAKKICQDGGIPLGWIDHSNYVANAAKFVAAHAGMDPNAAYVCGLFHDIGRCFSKNTSFNARHAIDGYNFMVEKNFPEIARFCMTHEFFNSEYLDANNQILMDGFSRAERDFTILYISKIRTNQYDKLIQLADALSTKDGYATLEQRVMELMQRKGEYEYVFEMFEYYKKVKHFFDKKIGCSVYSVIPDFWTMAQNFEY